MDKKYALLFGLMITGLIASNAQLISMASNPVKLESAMIKEVLDGDTFDLEDGRRIRLLNVNAPEKNQPLSDFAIAYLENLTNKTVNIQIMGKDIYGRNLARVYYPDYKNLEMVGLGLVHISHIEDSEKSLFLAKQDEAFEKGLGIWQKSQNYGCIDLEINKKDEFVIISNTCDLNFTNLALKDESTRTFNFNLSGNKDLKAFSGKGTGSESEVYIGLGNIWNNDKDSVFIRQADGLLLYYDHYGY